MATRAQTTIRKVRRISAPAPGFWGWALLGLLVLVVLAALGPVAAAIQAAAEENAKSALSAEGHRWASVEVSGQYVTLRGTPPDDQAAEAALAAVERARAPTWLGMAAPVWLVRDEFDREASPVTTDPSLRLPEWAFRLEDGVLELTGEVPDVATRQALEAAARDATTGSDVDVHNQLVVVEGEGPVELLEVAERGIANVSQCDVGVAEFSCGRYSLLCELPESRAAAVRAAATAPLPVGEVGSVQVLANEAVASCERDLAAVLQRSTIRFATESDEIDAKSAPVLDAVAAAAQSCPGTLRIEGHTDNTGNAPFNDSLSQRRAASVRQALVARGLPGSRLVAQGYGARVPVADNRTPAGRSRNRRIEIRVVGAAD